MKKQTLIKCGIGVIAGIVMILISFIRIQTVLPSGGAFMPVAGIIAAGLTMALGLKEGLLTALIATLISLLCGTADWVVVVNYLLLVLAIWVVTRGQANLNVQVTHQQLLWLALLTGFLEFIFMGVIYALIGLVIGGTTNVSLTFVQQVLPNALLTGLLYAFLLAPVSLLFRWLSKKLLHIKNNHDDHDDDNNHGSVIVDLSDHQDKK